MGIAPLRFDARPEQYKTHCTLAGCAAQPRSDAQRSTVWRLRRWAEQAYTAIHGPRR